MNTDSGSCPFCGSAMPGWSSRYPAATCNVCERPLIVVPSILRRERLKVLSAVDLAKVLIFPMIGGAIISFGIGNLSADNFAKAVASALLAWGIIDVWDGTAGLKTRIDRVRKEVRRRDDAAKKTSLAKTIFGLSSAILGAAGIMLV